MSLIIGRAPAHPYYCVQAAASAGHNLPDVNSGEFLTFFFFFAHVLMFVSLIWAARSFLPSCLIDAISLCLSPSVFLSLSLSLSLSLTIQQIEFVYCFAKAVFFFLFLFLPY